MKCSAGRVGRPVSPRRGRRCAAIVPNAAARTRGSSSPTGPAGPSGRGDPVAGGRPGAAPRGDPAGSATTQGSTSGSSGSAGRRWPARCSSSPAGAAGPTGGIGSTHTRPKEGARGILRRAAFPQVSKLLNCPRARDSAPSACVRGGQVPRSSPAHSSCFRWCPWASTVHCPEPRPESFSCSLSPVVTVYTPDGARTTRVADPQGGPTDSRSTPSQGLVGIRPTWGVTCRSEWKRFRSE